MAFNKKFVFAVLLPKDDNVEYWHNHVLGIQKAAKEYESYGVVLEFFFYDFDAKSFSIKAKEVLKSTFQGLLFAPVFHDESIIFLKKWKEKNTAVVMVDSNLKLGSPHAYFGQDAFKSGFLAGKLISLSKYQTHQILVVKITREIETTSVYLQRMEGFTSFFTNNPEQKEVSFTEVTIKDTETNQLTLAVFKDIDSIFVPNSRAYLIAEFLEKNKIKGIRIVGYDLLEQNKAYLKKGMIDFLINQKPEIQSYMAIECLYKQLVLQESVLETQYMPLEIIVKENLEE